VQRSADGRIAAFEADGHAGFAAEGSDIVCAGVSALTETAALGLSERLRIAAVVRRRKGFLSCRMPAGLDESTAARAQDLLETMLLGLRAIARAYPGRVGLRDRADGVGGVTDAGDRPAALRAQEGRRQQP
jgi:uncharacterized protein YsxB (DUF464 family)